MSRAVLRIAALSVVLAVLGFGLWQRQQVASFASDERRDIPGMALRDGPEASPWWPASFAEAATVEAFVRRGDGLFNVYSLSSGQASLKDCKT
jgi:hypothetical protein